MYINRLPNANFKDLTDKVFGRLTVLRHVDWYINPSTKKRAAKWECICICGNKIVTLGSSLSYGATTSCGCLKVENINKLIVKQTKKKGVASFNKLFRNYKQGAKDRKLCFNLTKEQFKKIVKSNCSICGIEPKQIIKDKTTNGPFIYNGIDRIDNKVGYTLDNCRPMCKTCNFSKRDLTEVEYQQWLTRIRGYNANG